MISSPSPTHRERVPLGSWFYALILVTWVLILLLHRLNVAVGPTSTAFQEFNLERIAAFAEVPSEFRVVMFGNSRLKYATETESRLAEMSKAQGIGVKYLRIVQDEAEFADFEQFLEPILALEPDLVVLQAPLFVTERVRYWNWRGVQQHIIAAIRGESANWQHPGKDQDHLQFGTPCAKTRHGMTHRQLADMLLEERVRRTKARAIYDWENNNAAAVRNFVAHASAQGTEVVALGIPRTTTVTEALRDFDGERLIADEVLADPEIAWTFPESVSDEEYCDLIHMDVSARRLYSEWLVERVAERLSPQDSPESVSARAALKRINRS